MPVATRKAETVKHDLKTCEGGFVVLRQLSYDEVLERRDGATQMLMERGVRNRDNPQMAIKIANKWANTYSFPRCIVDHNLTDSNEILLDFSKPEQVFKFLDPKVGAEIEALIDEMNQEAEENENFTGPADSSSTNESSSASNDSDPS